MNDMVWGLCCHLPHFMESNSNSFQPWRDAIREILGRNTDTQPSVPASNAPHPDADVCEALGSERINALSQRGDIGADCAPDLPVEPTLPASFAHQQPDDDLWDTLHAFSSDTPTATDMPQKVEKFLIKVPQTPALPVADPYDEAPPPYFSSQPQGEGSANEGVQVIVIRNGMVSSSDNEGSGDCQSPKNGTEEETSVKLRVPQLQKKRPAPTPRNSLMNQVYVSAATANILAKHSQNVCVKTKSETEMTSDQTKLCDTTVEIKRQEPSEEKERKTCEQERKKLQEEHQIKEEQHGEVTKERGRPRRKGPGGEEAVKEKVGCLRRRGQHGDKEVKAERGRPRRKGPGGKEAVKEEVGCLRRRGRHGTGELKQ
ncbi:hypothetical protein PAMA_022017 [Pampus argenteus]